VQRAKGAVRAHRGEVAGVARGGGGPLLRGEPVRRECLNRGEEPIVDGAVAALRRGLVGALEEAVVDQRVEHVQRRRGAGRERHHRLRGGQIEAPPRDAHLRQRRARRRRQQLPGPGDGRLQRRAATARVGPPQPATQELEARREAPLDLLEGEGAGAGGGQLDGQRQAVELIHQ